jgi:hypothetical protein
MTADLKFHPLSDVFPLMEGEDFDALVADIKACGLREPIVLLDGKILDGRNRYRACLAAEAEPRFEKHFSAHHCAAEALAFVISKNIHRRHLTTEQKRDLIAKLLKTTPEKSDRQIAKAVKASPTFVGKVRAEKEATGDVSTVDTRTDTRGRKQPATKTATSKPKPAPAPIVAEPAIEPQVEQVEQQVPQQVSLPPVTEQQSAVAVTPKDEPVTVTARAEQPRDAQRAEIERVAKRLVKVDPDLARELRGILRAHPNNGVVMGSALERALAAHTNDVDPRRPCRRVRSRRWRPRRPRRPRPRSRPRHRRHRRHPSRPAGPTRRGRRASPSSSPTRSFRRCSECRSRTAHRRT